MNYFLDHLLQQTNVFTINPKILFKKIKHNTVDNLLTEHSAPTMSNALVN